jgi:hypothetical protein
VGMNANHDSRAHEPTLAAARHLPVTVRRKRRRAWRRRRTRRRRRCVRRGIPAGPGSVVTRRHRTDHAAITLW